MSAQPVHYEDPQDPRDPQVILRDLPERERSFFLSEYQAKVDAARDPAGYAELRDFLYAWRLTADAMAQPGYDEALEEARTARTGGISLDEIDAMRRAAR